MSLNIEIIRTRFVCDRIDTGGRHEVLANSLRVPQQGYDGDTSTGTALQGETSWRD